MSHPVAATAGVYALLADGTTVEIRAAAPGDFDAVKAMHEAMSPDNAYLRFFSTEPDGRRAGGTPAHPRARRRTTPRCSRCAGGEVVGIASYEVESRDGSGAKTAEIAFAVADSMHHRGIATLLLEHLVSLARGRSGSQSFIAETLSGEHQHAARVLRRRAARAERPRRRAWSRSRSRCRRTTPAPQLDAYLDTVARRERSANVASLRPVFAPESVVGDRGEPAARAASAARCVDNILTGGYKGRLYAVNPHASQIGGVPSFPDVASLPEAPDLARDRGAAARRASTSAEACGVRGVRGLVVLTAGLDTAQSADLLAACRRHGMRLIGPNCFGIAVPGHGPGRDVLRDQPGCQAWPAWSCSPAASGSRWSTSSPGWASGSPRSPRSATSSTCPATTC